MEVYLAQLKPTQEIMAIYTTEEVAPNIPFPRRLMDGNDAAKPEFFFNSSINLRRLLKEKEKIEEEIKATMKEESYATDLRPLPHKEKDLRSFTLPCFINDISFNNALADLGASVSVPLRHSLA